MELTRRGAALWGASLLAALAALRLASSATPAAAFLLGRELRWPCVSRLWLGLPCPGCGMTRSVLLALGGEAGEALKLNPGGPLLVLGLVLLCASLLGFALAPPRRAGLLPAPTPRRLRLWGSAYGLLTAAAMVGHWVRGMV